MTRAFIAIDMPPPIRQKIEEVSTFFQTQAPPGALKWVSAENVHLTLEFLGELPETTINQIKTTLRDTFITFPDFELTIHGLGMYPNTKQPRVVWLGITGGKPLNQLHAHLLQALESIHILPDSKPFSPHLTLARARRGITKTEAQEIGSSFSQFKVGTIGTFGVGAIVLYQSQLTPKGPLYTPLLTLPLFTV